MSENTLRQPEDVGTQQSQQTIISSLPIPDLTTYNIRLAISLLVIICLGALASFSLTPVFLAQANSQTATNTNSSDGICTTQPRAIKYLQQPVTAQTIVRPPTSWSKLGKTSQDLTDAQTCAAAFTLAYETFNIKQANTLTAATSMLSTSAKKHFFTGTSTEPKDSRVDTAWLAQARTDQLQQSAQVLKRGTLQTAVQINRTNRVSASFIVAYQLTTIKSGRSSTKQQKLLVYLAEAPAAKPTGWQVIDWKTL